MKIKEKFVFNFFIIVAIIANLGLTIKYIYESKPIFLPLNIISFIFLIKFQKNINDNYFNEND